MKTLQFKTNINCSGCVAKVAPHLDAANGIKQWNVDTLKPYKILTVLVGDASKDDVIEAVSKAGFSTEELKN